MTILTTISRIVLPILAVLIILKCVRALFFGRPGDDTIAHISDPIQGEELKLNTWETSIGRSKACDLTLNYDTVSKFHAVIARRLDGWYVYDLGSKAGIKVNGADIQKKSIIKNGDKITFGEVVSYNFNVDHDPIIGMTHREKVKQKREEKRKSREGFNPYNVPGANPEQSNTSSQNYQYSAQSGAEQQYNPYFFHHEAQAPANDTVKEEAPISNTMLLSASGQFFEIKGNRFLFGSGKNCNILFNRTDIPEAVYATIELYQDGSWVLDRKSPYAQVCLNNDPITQPQILFNGDMIDVCGAKFTFKTF